MPQNLRAIRRKIKTVQGIAKITRTMKMVAAAKLRRVQGAVENGRAYWDALEAIVGRVASQAEEFGHPLLEARNVERVGLLVIGGSRGLCGSYNVSLHRAVNDHLRALSTPVRAWSVGPKAAQFLTSHACPPLQEFHSPADEERYAFARDLARMLQDQFLSGTVDEVQVAYTQFRSTINHVPTVGTLLPIEPPAGDDDLAASQYIFEPPAEELLATLLPRSVEATVYRMLLESAASEEASRMTAMTAATENAQDLVVDLQRDLNRARQAQITTELLEVISGAEALMQE